MASLSSLLFSTIGKKIINGATGIGLMGFIIVHLAGNLAILFGAAEMFNRYAHVLESTGELLYVAEAILAALFLLHIITAVSVWWSQKMARPDGYARTGDAKGNSKKTISSKTMIWTGVILLAFLIYHLATLKYGPGVDAGYTVSYDGDEMRDLYGLVVDLFADPIHVILYSVSMILLGFHLRHGFWSAFQSIGFNHPRWTPFLYSFAVLFALVMAAGFLVMPIVVYLRGGAA